MYMSSLRKVWADLEKIGGNSTLPVTINSIHFIGGRNTRRDFLDRLFDPLLSANRDQPYTLSEALHEVSGVATKLQRFGTRSCSPTYLKESADGRV
jgi:hypothetical protein